MCARTCVRVCNLSMVGIGRAALHAKLTSQAVRVSLHGTHLGLEERLLDWIHYNYLLQMWVKQ